MRIFATNHDIGSANSMIPALRLLSSEQIKTTLFSAKEAPARQAFANLSGAGITQDLESAQAKLEPRFFDSLFAREEPDVVLIGVSTNPNGSEKLALGAAITRGIPTVVLVESWPHLWLVNYGGRDSELYRQATRILAFDELSRTSLRKFGFREEQIIVTGNPENDQLASMKQARTEIGLALKNEFGLTEEELVFTFAITNNLEKGQLDITVDDPRWLGFKESDAVIEFLQAIKRAELLRPIRAILRIKPRREREFLEELVRQHCPGTIIVGEECQDGRRVILASDVVVGTTTTMLQTTSFLGVLPVSFLPKLCRPDPQFANSLGLIKVIKEEGQLGNLILSLARCPGQIRVEQEALTQIPIPNNATELVATAIRSVITTSG